MEKTAIAWEIDRSDPKRKPLGSPLNISMKKRITE
jgi:hypothetical protein